jgi:hypothetical protein
MSNGGFADASLGAPAKTPMLSRSGVLLTLLLGSLAVSCAHVAEPRDKTATKAPKLSKERQVLSEGYSLLYQDARKFDASELVLLVKAESDAMKKVVNALNPALAGFEASCFDGHYVTGDVSQEDFDAMQVQRSLQLDEEEDGVRSRLALQGIAEAS